MLIKPSLVLQVKLTPEDYSEECAAEIKRSYIYIAQSLVSQLDETDTDGNVMTLSVRLARPYTNPEDAKSQELWEQSVMPWLVNATRNMSTAMHNYNTVDHPAGAGNIVYSWADYDFGPMGTIRVKVDIENRIPAGMPAVADAFRTLVFQGALGENVARVRVPSRASYEAQLAAARAAEAERMAQEAREAAAEGEETPSAEELLAQVPAVIPFETELNVWDIEYADGSVKEFNTEA